MRFIGAPNNLRPRRASSIAIARTVFAALVVVAGSTIGCIIGPTTSSTGSGGDGGSGGATTTSTKTSSTGGSTCDATATCGDCWACAAKSMCAQQAAACNANSACLGIDQCLQLCGSTPDCAEQCALQNQPGVADYNAVLLCFDCYACPTKCAGQATCN